MLRLFATAVALSFIACSSGSLDNGHDGGGGAGFGTGEAGGGGTGGFAGVGTGEAGAGGTGGFAGVGGSVAGSPGRGGASGGGPSGGASGNGGSGGAAARGGSGPGESCLPMTPSCPSTLCGNGVRDTCRVRAGLGFCPEVDATEICDGADLGGETCEKRGFGSGTLSCATGCWLDTSRCSECVPSAAVVRCGAAPVTADPRAMAVAATEAEVALAWIEGDVDGPPVLRFARFGPNLDLISATYIADPALGAIPRGQLPDPDFTGVSVAPIPSGWVIAGFVESDVFFHVLDASGNAVARTSVESVSPYVMRAFPKLVARAGGGPLMHWQTNDDVRAVVIAADGRSATPRLTVALVGYTSGPTSGTFAADAFHLMVRVTDFNGLPTYFLLFRIAPDGTLSATSEPLPGVRNRLASLAAGAGDLRVVYTDENEAIVWRKLTLSGAPSAAPVLLARESTRTAFAVGFDSDTVALLVGPTAAIGLGVMRVAANGAVVTPQLKLEVGATLAWYDVVRRGPDLVAMWTTGAPGFRIARVTP
jgi:hypothetical protein